MNTANIRIVISCLAAALLAPISTVYAAAGNSSDLLSYIPADSPYVVASTQPIPDELADKLEPTVDEILKSYRTILRYSMTAASAANREESNSNEELQKVQGLADELLELMSVEGIRAAGIARDSAFAFYGNGLLPVFRFELSDEALFDKTIERFEQRAGEKMLQGSVKGEDYKYLDLEGMHLVIATIDEQVVITGVPAEFDEKQVAIALGVTSPRRSLKKQGTLKKIGKQYGFSNYLTGYIDSVRIAETFSGDASGLDAELFALSDKALPEWSDECKSELMELVSVAPRMVFGYTEVSTKALDSSFIIELREDIAAGLSTIPTAVPGLGVDPGGFMSLGFGMNPLKAKEFVEARLTAMEEDPFVCEQFASLQAGVPQARAALNQPLPPMVYGFRGFFANMTNMDISGLSSGKAPDDADGTILLAMENAQSLLMMAAMLDPQIASLELAPDGKPVKLEMPQLAEFTDNAYAALSESALSLSLGNAAEKNSAEALVADSVEPPPFMSVSMDAARYYEMMGDAMLLETPDDEGNEMPLEMRQTLRDMMILSGSIYERAAGDVFFTERGIEINGRMTIAD